MVERRLVRTSTGWAFPRSSRSWGAGKAHESWAPRRTRESPVEWAGRLWCRASRHDVRSYAGRRGRPARHQLRARKDGRSPACCRELKMEDAAARESGRVS
ncbi:hypothetical protein VULLAG_LOCUS15854 [Vulpes lagopus]